MTLEQGVLSSTATHVAKYTHHAKMHTPRRNKNEPLRAFVSSLLAQSSAKEMCCQDKKSNCEIAIHD